MTAGKSLEAQPFPEFIGPVRYCENDVLVADAVLAFPIYAWLIRGHHSRQQRLGIEVLAYVLRAFVHTEIETHSVASAVTEITPGFPEGLAGKYIQLTTGSTLGKNRGGEFNHTLEHQSVVLLFKRSAGSKGNGAGDIRGAGKILASGIHQIQASRFQLPGTFGRGDIMRQGGRWPIGRNVFKTLSPVAVDLSPERTEFQ